MKKDMIDELKRLDVTIGKRLFSISKVKSLKKYPSPLQAKILKIIIDKKNQEVCQKELEEKLRVSKATISSTLDTMEKNHLIIRTISKADGRKRIVSLTENSLTFFQEMKERMKRVNQELLRGITEEEMTCFCNILNKMIENLENRKDKLC